jgi:negative regulator of flagellin synthesis FlgM
MKIGQSLDYSNLAKPPTADADALKGAAKGAGRAAPSAGVEVTVSNEVRAMKQAQSSDAPDVDMAKVNAVRAAIEQGTYVVNPAAIADKLLANAQDMLSRNSR